MESEELCSFEFHYGGKFILVPKPHYEEGRVQFFSGIRIDQLNTPFLNDTADMLRIKRHRRFFALPKRFVLLSDDKVIANYVKKHVTTSGYNVCIFVEGEIDYIMSNVDLEGLVETQVVRDGVVSGVEHGGAFVTCDDDDMSEDYVVNKSEDDFLSECDSDYDQPVDKIKRGTKYCHLEDYDPQFEVEMTFSTRDVLRKAIHAHAIKTMRNIKLKHCERKRVTAKCDIEGCEWSIHARLIPDEHGYKIVDYNPEHACCPTFRVSNLKSSWLVEKYLSDFKTDPNRNLEAWRQDIVKKVGVHVSWYQANRARKAALTILEGDPAEQYKLLYNYREELLRSNPGSTVIIQPENSTGQPIFWSFYVCFGGLKEGFAAGCRKIIGLDGAHLSGPHGGILLTAVGQDPNNKPFPLAYAIVGSESAITWEWFLGILKNDLNINPEQYTFISDRQKGLIKACGEVFRGSDHRFCIRHMWKNMVAAGFKGDAFKEKLYKASNATSLDTFKIAMKELSDLDPKAIDWLADKHPEQWSKSHFSTMAFSDLTLNNICETINKALVPARRKPILVMAEWIREWYMQRMQKNRDKAELKWKEPICPAAKKILEYNTEKVKFCRTLKVNDDHFQVSVNQMQYNVDFENYTCSCRRWQLVGIPCSHALSAIGYRKQNKPVDYVHGYYSVETYKKVYAPAIFGINGPGLWPETNYIPPLPPNFGRNAGRPQHLRRRAADEPKKKVKNASKTGPKNTTHSRRIQKGVKCRYCNLPGHNSQGCQKKKADEIEKLNCESRNVSQEFQENFSHVVNDEMAFLEESDIFDYFNIDPTSQPMSQDVHHESEPIVNQVADLSIDSISIIEPSPSMIVFGDNVSTAGHRAKLQVVKRAATAERQTSHYQSFPSQSSNFIQGPSSWEQLNQHQPGMRTEQIVPGVMSGGKRYVKISEFGQVLKKQRKDL